MASRMASLIWSAILSGWPSVTDSDVKRRRGTRYSLSRDGRRVGNACRGNVIGPPPGARRSAVGRACHPGDDRGPDGGGDGVLAAARDLDGAAVGTEDD